jgi:DNA-binding MarR family transcriptional regulator
MQYGLLVHVQILQPASTTAISATTGHDISTLSRTLAPLKKAGFIRETRSASEDKRVKLFEITPQGKEALDFALEAWEKVQNTLLRTLDEGEWQTTLSILRKLQGQ